MKIENKVLERLITGNDMSIIDLCDEIWYSPQKHWFYKVNETLVTWWGWEWQTTLEELYGCKIFIEHINLYISNITSRKWMK